MLIKSVDDKNRLFLIKDIIPINLLNELLAVNWNSLPWKRGEQQETWNRRQLQIDNFSVFNKANEYLHNSKDQIEKEIGIKFDHDFFTMWWYDEKYFTVPIHTDGHLPASMQIFWAADANKYGTVFYEFKNETCVKYRFDFEPNSGYLMLNGLNDDGSQPLQWHGMLTSVEQYRISSYTNLGSYSKLIG